MLRFFSKIRYKLAAENKVGKYMRYAVGEILLVVIGILIALQVNNWNEERKQHVEFKSTLEALKQDLRSNIDGANSVIYNGYNKDSIITLALNKNITREMYRGNLDLRNVITFHFYTPVQDNLSTALSFENHIPNNYKALVPQLKLLSAQFDRWENIYNSSTLDVKNYNRSLAERFSWFSGNDSLAVESNIDYLLNDPIYLNALTLHRFAYLHNNVYNVTELRSLSAVILANLEQIEKNDRESDLNTLFQELGLKPDKQINDTTGIITNSKLQFRTSHLWYNASDQPVDIVRFQQYTTTLSPGEFHTPSVPDGELVEVVFKNKDSQFYQTVIDGYLLIEN